jgi:hypothetical protein
MEMRPILPPGSASTLRPGTLAIAAVVGHDTLDRQVALLRPLRAALGGAIVLVDDGSLGGADRVRLARACGDPAFAPARPGAFPDGPEWTLLRAALEGRRNAYWLMLDEGDALDAAVPELARAIAANRSFAVLGEVPADLAPHLADLAREGWPYLPASSVALGLAAGGDGIALATAILNRLQDRLGAERARAPDMARVLAGFFLARERDPVLLRYKW